MALEVLVYSRISSPYFWTWNPPESLSQDARLLLDKCKALKNHSPPEPCIDKNGYPAALDKKVVALVEDVLADWSYGTVLKLTLASWHFDPWHFEKQPASASDDLISFLSRPNKAVIEILQDRYRSMMGQGAVLNDSFDFLLVLN
jgi:hypothetical protein